MSSRQKYNLEEVLEKTGLEHRRLSRLVLTSIIDPAPRVRLAAIAGLHYRYSPQIRKAYVVDDWLLVETLNETGGRTPYFIDILPWENTDNAIRQWLPAGLLALDQ